MAMIGMKKLSLTSIRDFFQPPARLKGYSAVNIKLSSVKYIEPVKKQMENWGLETFALIDQLKEIKTAFIFIDMFLAAVAMTKYYALTNTLQFQGLAL